MKQLPEEIKQWLDDPKRDHFDGLSILSHLTTNRMLIRNLSRKENKYTREKLLGEIQKLSKEKYPVKQAWPSDPKAPSSVKPEGIPSKPTPQHKDDDDSGHINPEGYEKPVDESESTNDSPPADHPGGTVIHEPAPSTDGAPPPNDEGKQPAINITADNAKSAEDMEISYSKMYNLCGKLSNSLREFKPEDNDGRSAVLARIADIRKSMSDIEEKIKHFKLHGVLPSLDESTLPADNQIKEKPIPEDRVQMQRMLMNDRSTLSKLKKKIAKGVSDPEKLKELEQQLLYVTERANEIQRRMNGSGS